MKPANSNHEAVSWEYNPKNILLEADIYQYNDSRPTLVWYSISFPPAIEWNEQTNPAQADR